MTPPGHYNTAGTLMLISGVINALLSLYLVLILIWVCVGVVFLIPLAGGLAEIITGLAVVRGQTRPAAPTLSIVGIISSALCCNPIGLVLEIVAQALFRTREVTLWLEEVPQIDRRSRP